MFRSLLLGGLALVLTAALSQADTSASDKAGKDDWPQWRGLERDAHSPDTGLLQKWPKAGPPRLWEAKGAGLGYSSLAVTGGRIYTLGDTAEDEDNPEEFVSCFDESTGKRLWKTRVGETYKPNFSPSWRNARSTPTVVGDRLYVITPQGLLVCLDIEGKQQWQKDLKMDLGGTKRDMWGYSESVLIDGDRLVCTPGGAKAAMVALNPKDGEVIWKATMDRDWGAGHSSVVVAEVGGTRVYVQAMGDHAGAGVVGVRAKDGKVLWTHATKPTTAVIPTPIIHEDLVFSTAGYGAGGTLLRQVPGSDGSVTVEVVYPLNKRLQNKHGGVILVDNFLYGDSDDGGNPFCAELKTGKVRWTKRDSKGAAEKAGRESASTIYADGHLYIHYADGTMVLAKASPESYQVSGWFKLKSRSTAPGWAHPVIAGKKLFVREGDYISCYDLRQK